MDNTSEGKTMPQTDVKDLTPLELIKLAFERSEMSYTLRQKEPHTERTDQYVYLFAGDEPHLTTMSVDFLLASERHFFEFENGDLVCV
jgi:hypothetical protein